MDANSTVQAIKSIELVPPIRNPDVLTRLNRTIEQAQKVRAVIAYWCVKPDVVNPTLIRRLSGDGFLCVDFHLPTDIDILGEMKASGANVFLHLLHPNPQPGDLRIRMPEYLLHPKILLCDLSDGSAELWVGSHNWTARALSGLNIEASLILRLEREGPLYGEVERFLEDARSLCEPFDLSSASYYKWLQGQAGGDSVWVLEVQGKLAPELSGTRVTVFETSEAEYKNLRNVDKDLMLSALAVPDGEEHLYQATITDTGRLERAGVGFDSRIHGLHTGRGRPEVDGPTVPDAAVLKRACAWATVQVKERLRGTWGLYEVPPRERWQALKDDPFEGRVASEARKLFSNPGKALVSRPVSKEEYEGKKPSAPREAMEVPGHALVRRMILREIEGRRPETDR
jgi:hypothetical protein